MLVMTAEAICFPASTDAQPGKGYHLQHHFLSSGNKIGNKVADKNFYLLTALDHSPQLKQLLAADPELHTIFIRHQDLIRQHASDNIKTTDSLLDGLKWSHEDSLATDQAIRSLYTKTPAAFDALVDRELRPSGMYQRWVTLGNPDLLLHAWGLTVRGVNYILDVYGYGKKLRYAAIDSASYDVHGDHYKNLLKTSFSYLVERSAGQTLFYEPSRALALQLLLLNDRDEAARHEPLETGENRSAVQKARQLHWNDYPYALILVPGEGPELAGQPISPAGRMRCELAATRYKKGMAPFIVVSGGYVHPFHTPYAEAVEMKKYLMTVDSIPGSAILIEPQARHTTTNFRNTARLQIRYGIPLDKACLCVSTRDQTDYIINAGFDRRNLRELGYLPYRDKQRLSDHEIRYYAVADCLQSDPGDPLDP